MITPAVCRATITSFTILRLVILLGFYARPFPSLHSTDQGYRRSLDRISIHSHRLQGSHDRQQEAMTVNKKPWLSTRSHDRQQEAMTVNKKPCPSTRSHDRQQEAMTVNITVPGTTVLRVAFRHLQMTKSKAHAHFSTHKKGLNKQQHRRLVLDEHCPASFLWSSSLCTALVLFKTQKSDVSQN